jgi:hypothetical protein
VTNGIVLTFPDGGPFFAGATRRKEGKGLTWLDLV